MVTIYSIPRTPVGIFDRIQKLAIRSWLAIDAQVILIGDNTLRLWAQQFDGITFVRSDDDKYGTPYIRPAILAAEDRAKYDVCGFFNADNILLDDFVPAIDRVAARFEKFVAVGQRTNLDITSEVRHFDGRFKEYAQKNGELFTCYGIDYFVYQGLSLADDFPPEFLIGRNSYDNWLVRHYVYSDVPLVDLTPEVTVVHANHPPQQKASQQMAANRQILGEDHAYGIHHSDFRLTHEGIERR